MQPEEPAKTSTGPSPAAWPRPSPGALGSTRRDPAKAGHPPVVVHPRMVDVRGSAPIAHCLGRYHSQSRAAGTRAPSAARRPAASSGKSATSDNSNEQPQPPWAAVGRNASKSRRGLPSAARTTNAHVQSKTARPPSLAAPAVNAVHPQRNTSGSRRVEDRDRQPAVLAERDGVADIGAAGARGSPRAPHPLPPTTDVESRPGEHGLGHDLVEGQRIRHRRGRHRVAACSLAAC
ncbi:MAG: hypothetical protein QOJ19_1328 [Acidimicrobiia bacterium]|nr:hypothetical protein [Acidimicrobiia bacterium]